MQTVYSKDGFTATAWLPQRVVGMPDSDNQDYLRFIVTAIRIHSWVNVTLGSVQLRTISALMTGPFKSPELEGEPSMPFRDDDMIYPGGGRSIFEPIHMIADDKNDAIDDWNGKFLRAGLWHSALLAGGTLVGYENRLYIVPHDELDDLARQIKQTGARAFEKYDSFIDPSLQYTDARGIITEPDGISVSGSPARPASPGDTEILEILRAQHKFAAIKRQMELTGQGLKDAKEYVDELAYKHGLGPKPTPSSSGCFIATAACGPADPDVWALRRYRDTVLSAHAFGRIVAHLYARISPPLARIIENSSTARRVVRAAIVIPLARLVRQRTTNNNVQDIGAGAPNTHAGRSHTEKEETP